MKTIEQHIKDYPTYSKQYRYNIRKKYPELNLPIEVIHKTHVPRGYVPTIEEYMEMSLQRKRYYRHKFPELNFPPVGKRGRPKKNKK